MDTMRDVYALAEKVEKLAPKDLLLGALMLLERNEMEMAEALTRKALEKMQLAKLLQK